jgi:hypothetical protein
MSQISMFSYEEGPKSDLFFRGTPIAANAQGRAEVQYEDGNAKISARAENLPPPTTFGPYTTYVLWALTPDGRASNQGVLANEEGGKGELQTMHSAPQFALIVTAEPHFAVTVPSTMIALYNVADDVRGRESKVTTLTERADYSKLASIPIDEDANPASLVEARYAVAIAEAAGAEQFAPQPYGIAKSKVAEAEAALSGNRKQRDTADELAREAIVAGEDARRAALLGAAAEADRKATAEAAAAAAEVERVASAAAAEQATRDELVTRLNAALPTRETDRGLVSEIGGVQFASGTAELSSGAREALARFAGIVPPTRACDSRSRVIRITSAASRRTRSSRYVGRSRFATI